jgi:hypothetical protein
MAVLVASGLSRMTPWNSVMWLGTMASSYTLQEATRGSRCEMAWPSVSLRQDAARFQLHATCNDAHMCQLPFLVLPRYGHATRR